MGSDFGIGCAGAGVRRNWLAGQPIAEGQNARCAAGEFLFELLAAVILEAALAPVGDVHFGDGIGQRRDGRIVGGLEFEDDVAIAEAVVDHAVDEVAGGLGEPGDFAVARTSFRG